ncbi:MAG: multicopper oxidase [Desulfuromonadaceae bacterium]|nr:multicopper oxidase [Desulfuromonadaceae bacterium]
MKNRHLAASFLAGAFALMVNVQSPLANTQILQTPLPGKNIPKFVEPMPVFGPASGGAAPRVQAGTGYSVTAEEFQQMVLPASMYAPLLPPFNAGSYVWGYKVGAAPALYPGFTVEAQRGTPIDVTYVNNLQQADGTPPILQKYITVDQTLHWADPTGQMGSFAAYAGPVPMSTHMHGAEVSSFYDGGPGQWFTPTGVTGAAYATAAATAPGSAIYHYPNTQEATTLWFHDHALGATRTNVYGGLAAFYLLRDAFDTGVPATGLNLPAGAQEMEVVIQDRMFDTNGQLLFPDLGLNPATHPFWIPEFFGDTIVVNGKSWPFQAVSPQRYRLRLLNGSNARFYNLKFDNKMVFYQIGTDGGLLDAPVPLTSLLIAPGERADVIVDFTAFANTNILLTNNAKAPFPNGAPADPKTVGQIMQFRVGAPLAVADASFNPAVVGATLRGGIGQPPAIVRLVNPLIGTASVIPSVKRQLTLKEVMGMAGPLEVLVNNTKWSGKRSTDGSVPAGSQFLYGDGMMQDTYASELPRVGDTEQWEIINLTADAHPIHLHLVQFQLVNRQPFQGKKYDAAWSKLFPGGIFAPGYGPPLDYLTPNADGAVGGNPAITPYLQGKAVPPLANEAGWKDTVVMYPGEVSRILVRWAPTDSPTTGAGAPAAGVNQFAFDPTTGPGYVWHCHIIDHEDNEMMRPYRPQL